MASSLPLDPFQSLLGCPHIFGQIAKDFKRYDWQKMCLLSKGWQEYLFDNQHPLALDQELFLNRAPVRDPEMFELEWLDRTITSVNLKFIPSDIVSLKLRPLFERAAFPPMRDEVSIWNGYLPLVVCKDNNEVDVVLQVKI